MCLGNIFAVIQVQGKPETSDTNALDYPDFQTLKYEPKGKPKQNDQVLQSISFSRQSSRFF